MSDQQPIQNAAPGDTIDTQLGKHTLAPWERVVDGVLEGPGYAVDLATDDLLYFASPSSMRRAKRDEPASGSEERPS